jgi:hypothetical protein
MLGRSVLASKVASLVLSNFHGEAAQMIVVEHHCYQPPKPSRAMRPFARKTPNHFVGELTFGEEKGQGQTLGFGSKLEHDIALISIYRPGVIDVCEQVEVSFIKSDGKVSDVSTCGTDLMI